MFAYRHVREGGGSGQPAVTLAFTDRHARGGADAGGLDLTVAGPVGGGGPAREVLAAVAAEFSPEHPESLPIGMRQVHGADVAVLDESYDGSEIVADALVTDRPGVTLLARAADCVPVLLASADNTVIGAVHSGRPGVVAGVVPAAVSAMRALGAEELTAWVGPHVCGRCYEVPEQMREDVAAVVPETWAETSWGTPAVDIGAGVRAQLESLGVSFTTVDRCTFEDADLWSYRRDGAGAGRLGGLIRIGS